MNEVWIVYEYDYSGTNALSVWPTCDEGDRELARLEKRYPQYDFAVERFVVGAHTNLETAGPERYREPSQPSRSYLNLTLYDDMLKEFYRDTPFVGVDRSHWGPPGPRWSGK